MFMANCDPGLLFMGPFAMIVGGFCFYIGIMAWMRPDSDFVQGIVVGRYPTHAEADPISRFFGWTQETSGPANMMVWRLLGPLNGSIFVLVGFWVTLSGILCRAPLPDLRPLLGPLEWRPWAPGWFFIAFCIFIGVQRAYSMRPVLRELTVLTALLIGVAAAEAAAFHTGIQAVRWFVLAIIPTVFLGALSLLSSRIKSKDA
jgi:hypothetical protein